MSSASFASECQIPSKVGAIIWLITSHIDGRSLVGSCYVKRLYYFGSVGNVLSGLTFPSYLLPQADNLEEGRTVG
jgi:hypothetical protein